MAESKNAGEIAVVVNITKITLGEWLREVEVEWMGDNEKMSPHDHVCFATLYALIEGMGGN